MTHNQGTRIQERISRLLGLVGDLLREVGELALVESPVEQAPIEQAATQQAPTEQVPLEQAPAAQAAARQVAAEPRTPVAAPVADTPPPPSEPAPASPEPEPATSEETVRREIAQSLQQGFRTMFGETLPAATPAPARATEPAESYQDADPAAALAHPERLVLLCEDDQGTVAIPWQRVVGVRLTADGTPESFMLESPEGTEVLGGVRVLGLLDAETLREQPDRIRWLGAAVSTATGAAPETVVEAAPAPPVAPQPSTPVTPQTPSAAPPPAKTPPPTPAREVREPAEPTVGPEHAAPAGPVAVESPIPAGGGNGGAQGGPVWVVSPSALARRFLMRHLSELGIEVLEARDLEDPLLPADLTDVGGLFLDESLLESWQARPASGSDAPPVVLLTVDRALTVPPRGTHGPEGAILPRPFERSEVERVVGWLRSLWEATGTRVGRSDHHGNEEDGTWLFADPFGTSGTGEHSRR